LVLFIKYNLPTLLWATVILLLTLLPAASMPQLPAWELISVATLAHAIVFFILTVLMLRGFTKQSLFLALARQAAMLTFIGSVLFGAGIEALQMVLNWGRQGDPLDVISNTIGTVSGIAAYFWLLKKSPLKAYF
jgi:glycopeptide antibiotics resistance protein